MKRILWKVFRLINAAIIASLVALAMGIGTKPSPDSNEPKEDPGPETGPSPDPIQESQAE